MISRASILIRALAILVPAVLLKGNLQAADNQQHLLPASANFDTLPPYGKQYADLAEKLLFPTSTWVIRYFQVIGDPAYDTGLTVYQKPNGAYRLMLKQARPAIGDIVMNAFYGRVDLQSSIASLKIETADREIPDGVAMELRKLWLALVQGTRVGNRVDKAYYIHPAKVILSTKDSRGTVLSGKYPLDAAKHRIFTSIEAIIDDLVKSCDAPAKDRVQIFKRIAKRAQLLRATLNTRQE